MKLKDGLITTVKGIIAGIGSLIPGISPASLFVSLSSYEKFISSFANITKRNNKGLYLIALPLLLGLLIGLLTGAHIVNFLTEKYLTQTIFLFIGLITGGYMLIIRKEKLNFTKTNLIVFLIIFALSIIGYLLITNNFSLSVSNYLYPVIGSLTVVISLLIPSVSLSSSYIILNRYDDLINTFSSFSILENISAALIFIISFLIFLIALSKLITFFLKKHRNLTFIIISALMTASIVIAILEIKNFTPNFVNIFTPLLAFLWGYLFAKNVEKE